MDGLFSSSRKQHCKIQGLCLLTSVDSPVESFKEESEEAEQSSSFASWTIKHQSSILSSEVAIRVYTLISLRGKRRC